MFLTEPIIEKGPSMGHQRKRQKAMLESKWWENVFRQMGAGEGLSKEQTRIREPEDRTEPAMWSASGRQCQAEGRATHRPQRGDPAELAKSGEAVQTWGWGLGPGRGLDGERGEGLCEECPRPRTGCWDPGDTFLRYQHISKIEKPCAEKEVQKYQQMG